MFDSASNYTLIFLQFHNILVGWWQLWVFICNGHHVRWWWLLYIDVDEMWPIWIRCLNKKLDIMSHLAKVIAKKITLLDGRYGTQAQLNITYTDHNNCDACQSSESINHWFVLSWMKITLLDKVTQADIFSILAWRKKTALRLLRW